MEKEMDLKSVEVAVTIGADSMGLSKMQLVFDANRPTEMFNGIAQAVKDIEVSLKQSGLLTAHGVGTGEYEDYLEYMKELVLQKEAELFTLYRMRTELLNSQMEFRFVMEEMVNEKIDEANKVVDEYYNMFDEIKVVPASAIDYERALENEDAE